MAESYVSSIQAALMAAFPGLSSHDAWSLAWGGLEGTAGWDALTEAQQQDIMETNNYHHAGSPNYGTKC